MNTARAKRRSANRPLTHADPRALALHATPERARLELLEKQHERLLRDIAKRKQALASLHAIADELLRDLFSALLPLKREIQGTVAEVRRLFEQILNDTGRLRRRDRRVVAEIYDDFLCTLPYDLLVATELPGLDDDASTDVFDEDVRSDAEFPFADDENDFGLGDEEAGYSAPRPEPAEGLRALFKRLVSRLHPDKVLDDPTKAERTAALKEVTQAYESGDLAKLLEIERDLALEVLASTTTDELTERAERLVRANKELRVQLRELTRQRKELRDELPFQLDLRSPGRLREQADAQCRELLEVAREELDGHRQTRDFVQCFADGKMSVRDFFVGPG